MSAAVGGTTPNSSSTAAIMKSQLGALGQQQNHHGIGDISAKRAHHEEEKDARGGGGFPTAGAAGSDGRRGEEGKSGDAGAGAGGEGESEESQLSHDLALFLSNPSLRTALADGSLDLASYSTTVQDELRDLEADCIAVYRDKSSEIAALKLDVVACQGVLSSLREMLLGFQADLGGLSGEIRNLQERSRTLDVQLRNRRGAGDGLRRFLERVVVSPNLAHCITAGSVDPEFLAGVRELNAIYRNCHEVKPQDWSSDLPPIDAEACKELQAVSHKLRLVAVTRIREYFLEQMRLLRRPQTNVRMIQVHGLLKYAPLQDFLGEACPEIANEVLRVYVESMSRTMLQLFRTYHQQLMQLDNTRTAATRHDVVAIDDALLRDALASRVTKSRIGRHHHHHHHHHHHGGGIGAGSGGYDVFCLGRRAADCLDNDAGTGGGGPSATSRPILAHVAQAEGVRYPFERIFRSILGHLVDAVTNEHVFGRQFFQRDIFGALFPGTLSYLTECIENYLFGCYDAICLLLMIKVTHSYRRVCRQRKIASLDPFFDQITKLLWPRLKTVMDNHLRSIQQATPQKLSLDVDNLHVHYVTRRFAEFCCSLLLVLHGKTGAGAAAASGNAGMGSGGNKPPATPGRRRSSTGIRARDAAGEEGTDSTKTPLRSNSSAPAVPTPPGGGGDLHGRQHQQHEASHKSAGEKLLEDLSEMIDEYVVLLDRLADEHTSSKKRIVFHINNMDHVVCIFQERRVAGREFNRFVEMLMRQRELFVEEELLTGFSKMIAFVQQTELHLSSLPAGQKASVNPQVVESLVLDFASNWKSNIEQMNRNVLSYFSNFRNGMEILKQVLTQLLLYYTRFHDIIRKVWRNKPPAFCKDLVPTNLILAEIKKYALAI